MSSFHYFRICCGMLFLGGFHCGVDVGYVLVFFQEVYELLKGGALLYKHVVLVLYLFFDGNAYWSCT